MVKKPFQLPSPKGSDSSVYVLLYMFASYHLHPRLFYRAHASSYQPTPQSPSFHQPRHTLHFSILLILLILSKTSTHSTQSTRLSKPPPSTRSTRLTIPHSSLFVYSVYFVVQIFASFAFSLTTVASAKVVAAIYSQKRSELIVSTGLFAATALHLARLCQAGNDLVQRIPWD